ncbi:hypothetical protein EV426DRAFT_396285 [Tirmania nivea]|nr:hypothetical protein EV426DRAFT_396285 [Tirmania nivea]
MLENGGPGGPGGMRMGMGMVGLDGVLNPNIGTGNMQRRGGNVPPIPRIPSMYKPSAQSVRNQNQMMNSSNYSQCPPAFRNGKPRNSQGRLSPQFPDFEGPPHYAMGRGQPPRMQSPRPLQPPHRSHSTGLRGPDMGPPSQDRRALKGMNENVNGHPNSETALLPTPDNSSAEDSVNPSKKPDLQQPQQSTIPTALPTPSLTPTPPSRSNSNEDRQNSDAESMHDEASEIPNRSGPPSEANSERTYKPWQENGQNHGYFRRPPPYQRIDPHHHGVSPPSPISAPTTPITASSASSTYGNSNHVIAQQIQVSVPIMPGPVKEICYTKDINLVMEECMMGHGRTGRGSVMRRTANWQHQVGCMMCGGYGGPGREGGESGPTLAGKHWLWLCNWCALRVCADCRCTLAKEEDHLREKGGNVGTLKVDLRALREKILEEKRQEQGRNRAEAVKERLSGDKSEKLVEEKINNQQVGKETLRAKVELLPVGIKAQKTQNDLPKKVDVPRDNTTSKTINQSRTHSPASFAVQHDRFSARPVNTITQHSLVLSTSSEESSNFFVAAGSGVELNGSQKVIGPAVKVYNKKTGYPPRVSSRDLATETKIEPNVSNKEPILSSPQTAAEPKQAGVTVAPMPLPVQTSTKITGIPVTQQPQAATVGYTPTPAVPAKPKSPARDLGSVIVPPTVPPKSPSPSRHATISSLPPQSSSSMPPSPIAQVKSLIPTSSTLQAQSNTVKQKPLTPDSPSPAPAEKFFLPPLSFESEVGNKIDNIVGTREYTAPKAQATHAEEAYKHEMVGSSRKGGRRWYKGLFGGRK